jgi:hypothetical protein
MKEKNLMDTQQTRAETFASLVKNFPIVNDLQMFTCSN